MSSTSSGHAVPKPQPRPNAISRPFWDGANEGRLMLQRCLSPACGRAIHYPRVCCPFCRHGELDWFQATGRGRIVSHTTIRRTHHESFDAEVPYVFAAVRVDEGPVMYAQIPGAPVDGPSLVDARVDVDFVDHGPGVRMPVFRLASRERR